MVIEWSLWWFESMQAVCSFFRARTVIKFILRAVGALQKTQIASSERYVNPALAGCFFNKRKCVAPSNPGDWSKFCEQKQSSIHEIFASSLSKGQILQALEWDHLRNTAFVITSYFKAFASLLSHTSKLSVIMWHLYSLLE